MSTSPVWPAPVARGPLDAVVDVPGSKSLTNRWLVLAALSDQPSRLRGALRSRDTDLMGAAVRALGCHVDEEADELRVQPAALRGPATVDCGLAGTVMRFVPPLACLATGEVRLDGDERARQRPLQQLTAALRELGADVEGDALPITVRGHGSIRGGEVAVDASASSQLISGLLLAAPRFEHGVVVTHRGHAPPSRPHLDMTVACLRAAGAVVDDSTSSRWAVSPGPVEVGVVDIEPDLSNAAPFLAAAMVAGGRVRVPRWPQRTTQAGDALRELLSAMGADVRLDADGLTVTGTGQVHGLVADLHDVGELVPTLVALAAVADSPTTITGVAHLRGHETDRLAALVAELVRLGVDAEELPDGIVVRPGPMVGAVVRTYGDHRMATAGALIGLRVPGVEVADIETTAKTLPGFARMWHAMLGAVDVTT